MLGQRASLFGRVLNAFDTRFFNGFVFGSTGSPYYSRDAASDRNTLADPTRYYGPRRVELGITMRGGSAAVVWSGEELLTQRAEFLLIPKTRGSANVENYVFLDWDEALRLTSGIVEEIAGQMSTYYFPATDSDALWSSLAAGAKPIRELNV